MSVQGTPLTLVSALALTAWIATVGCEPGVTSVGAWTPDASTGIYLEAESGLRSGGFAIGDDATASGTQYLSVQTGVTSDDAPGASQVRYEFTLGEPGSYEIWGRIRSPSTAENRFWFQVDGASWIKWRISVGDIWYWDAFHDDENYTSPLSFPLSAGPHELLLANCVDGAALDRLYITSNGDTPPGNDTPCDPPNSIELQGTCFPSCGSQGGNACTADICNGRPTLQAYDCAVCCIAP